MRLGRTNVMFRPLPLAFPYQVRDRANNLATLKKKVRIQARAPCRPAPLSAMGESRGLCAWSPLCPPLPGRRDRSEPVVKFTTPGKIPRYRKFLSFQILSDGANNRLCVLDRHYAWTA